jgi:hypothetical protein
MASLGRKFRPGTPGASGGKNYMRGFNEFNTELNKQLALIKGGTMKGMINAAAFLKDEMAKEDPLVPFDYGNLAHSWFTVTATGTHEGRGVPKFKGPRAARISSDHPQQVGQAKDDVARMTKRDIKVLRMGYTAYYAGFVHEWIGPVVWTGGGDRAKWFQRHLYGSKDKIFRKIANTSKIKK